MDLLNSLRDREQGRRNGFMKNINFMLMGRLAGSPVNDIFQCLDVGNTFVCKFSRNNNNLHIIGCSTEYGEIIIQNTSPDIQFDLVNRNRIHENAIFNFAWAEPAMKLVTACGDQTANLCSVYPSGEVITEKKFDHNSSVRTVMFCPGSSDIFCGAGQSSIIKIWDARINNNNSVLCLDHQIPNAHGSYGPNLRSKKTNKMYVISSLIFRNSQSIVSCSPLDKTIKLWDLRKTYCQVRCNTEPLPLVKYTNNNIKSLCMGYIDMVTNPQCTHLYASGKNDQIDCYLLNSTDTSPICHYSGYLHETNYSKISLSNDGRYLFSGCKEKNGVIWVTDYPYNKEPMFTVSNDLPRRNTEFGSSDWCADSNCLKLATSSDSIPMIWNMLSLKERSSQLMQCSKTSSYKNIILEKNCTVPIKLESELEEKYKKETDSEWSNECIGFFMPVPKISTKRVLKSLHTYPLSEERMNDWDLEKQNIVQTVDSSQVLKKNPWDIIFPKSSQVSPKHSSPSGSKNIPDAATPTSSKKRKKSMLSPRSLIDQYLIIDSKKKKLNTVEEN